MSGDKFTRLSKTGLRGDVQEVLTKELLIGAVITDIDTTSSGASLNTLTVLLKDGRNAILTEEHWRYYECDMGCITITIDGDEYP